jgi:hypothetical protein
LGAVWSGADSPQTALAASLAVHDRWASGAGWLTGKLTGKLTGRLADRRPYALGPRHLAPSDQPLGGVR